MIEAKADTKSGTKRVSILGATGSVGQHTLQLIDLSKDLSQKFSVEVLTANKNVLLLAKLAKKYQAKHAVIADPQYYQDLKNLLDGTGITVAAGEEAIEEAAALQVDVLVAGIVGAAGIKPTMAAIKQGTKIAFANKECLVCAGALMMEAVKKYKAVFIPVDSEHSAIFQVFDNNAPDTIEKIILTASGGPFLDYNKEQLGSITPQQATQHPNWNMGEKISVDSATMMNKGLELIEAFYLFPVREDQIEVVIHPESIIHSMVQYQDGSVLAQMGTPDMCTPISYALTYPQRMQVNKPRLDLNKVANLTFKDPSKVLFPSLNLSRQALRAGNKATIMLNAANEIAVAEFLAGRITFLDIFAVIEESLSKLGKLFSKLDTIDEVLAFDQECRRISISCHTERNINRYNH